jgi:hypothetical protein
MSFAESLADLNGWHFFSEFVFSNTTFRPTPSRELELADNLVWLGEIAIAFQLKERSVEGQTTIEAEERWFESKVVGKATKQVRDTLSYIQGIDSIELINQRGHTFTLNREAIKQFHKLVVYLPRPELPEHCRRKKFHSSVTAGFIHIISGEDYLGIVRTLLTPAEVADYLTFREGLVTRHAVEAQQLHEASLVGQYLSGDRMGAPSAQHAELVKSLQHRSDEWDMSGIIKRFSERTTDAENPTDYYHVIRELALLRRDELREFKLRYQLALENARKDKFAKPYRMVSTRTGCGFVVIPLTKELIPKRRVGLTNLTLAHKYDQKLTRCIGVAIGDDVGPWFIADWCFVEFAWEKDSDVDEFLKNAEPFRPVMERELPGYHFDE